MKLIDNRVYTIVALSKALKAQGLPYSKWWIVKQEENGLIRDPRISGTKEPRRYTGKLIKEIVESLVSRIEGN